MKKRKQRKDWTNERWRQEACTVAKELAVLRDSGQCQRCPKNKIQGWKIEGSHVFPEGKFHSMSVDLDNIKALCSQCHIWWHEHPTAAKEWYDEKFPGKYLELKERSLVPQKRDYKQVYEELIKIKEEYGYTSYDE